MSTTSLPTPSLVHMPEGGLPAAQETSVMQLEPQADQKPPAIIPEQTIKNIAIAIAKVTAGVGVIPKRGVNRFHNYKYVLMEDVMERLQILLPKYGLTILPTELNKKMFDNDRAIAVDYGFTLIHTSGEMWPVMLKRTGLSRCRDSRNGFDDKCFNKASTAARKYFYMALFNIASGEEHDADEDAILQPPSRPIQKPADPKHDATTGEIMDDEIPEWFTSPPEGDSPQSSTPAVVSAADKAGAPRSSTTGGGAPAETQAERYGRLGNRLAIAAENGTQELKAMWLSLAPADQRMLEGDLRSIYQPRAAEVTAAANSL